MKRQTVTGLVAVLTACGVQAGTDADTDTSPSPTVTMVGDTAVIELPVGRSADNGIVQISFEAVTEDSRCPSNVQCVWEGNGAVRLTLTGGGESQVSILNSTLDPRWVSFAGHEIALRDLVPYPVEGTPTDPGAYVAHIGIVEIR